MSNGRKPINTITQKNLKRIDEDNWENKNKMTSTQNQMYFKRLVLTIN